MKLLAVFAALALISTVSVVGYLKMNKNLDEGQLKTIWKHWKREHSKEYTLKGEEEKRYNIFKANHKIIEESNSADNSYTLGHNQFSDLTSKEFKDYYLGYNPELKKAEPTAEFLLSTENLPESVNWVTAGAVNAVKNQGQCGSCWAFSAVAGMEGANFVQNGKLVSLSEQELLDCDHVDQACNGGLMDNAFKFAETTGMDSESSYYYEARKSFFGCYAKKYTSLVQVKSFTDVTQNSEQALMAAVAQQPVSIAIEADQSAFQLYQSGVFSGTCGANLDHGVAAVGYGTEGGKAYWLVRNSWGASWGEQGYIKLARGLKVNNGAGQCGILQSASYPTVQ